MPKLTYTKSIRAIGYGKTNLWVIKIHIKGMSVFAILDTGCNADLVMSGDLAGKLKIESGSKSAHAATAGDKQAYQKLKNFEIEMCGKSVMIRQGITMEMPHVYTKKIQCVIGVSALAKMKAILDISKKIVLIK